MKIKEVKQAADLITSRQLIKMLRRFPRSASTNVKMFAATEDQDGRWKIILKISEKNIDKAEEK